MKFFGLFHGERFWSIESWKRHRLFRSYFYGGFSIGLVWFDWPERLK
jgi:hypothetical protein